MIDYARVSKMIEYRDREVWPLKKNSPVFRLGTRGWEYCWALEQLSDIPKGSACLDCGCGCGPYDFPIEVHKRGFVSHGLDFFIRDDESKHGYGIPPSQIERNRDKVSYINGNMHDIPCPTGSFDVVTCISVMEHVVIPTRHDPAYHIACLKEMARILKPGGALICTYDTIVNEKVMLGNLPGWGEDGWHYLKDIEATGLQLKNPNAKRYTYRDIALDEDAFFVPPDIYLDCQYGSGMELFGPYHRLTSIGFALVKPA